METPNLTGFAQESPHHQIAAFRTMVVKRVFGTVRLRRTRGGHRSALATVRIEDANRPWPALPKRPSSRRGRFPANDRTQLHDLPNLRRNSNHSARSDVEAGPPPLTPAVVRMRPPACCRANRGSDRSPTLGGREWLGSAVQRTTPPSKTPPCQHTGALAGANLRPCSRRRQLITIPVGIGTCGATCHF